MMRMAFSGAASPESRSQTPRRLQQIDRACEQRGGPRLDRARARRRGRADRGDAGAHMRERQRGDEARGAGADHGNVAHGMNFRHLAIAASETLERLEEWRALALAQAQPNRHPALQPLADARWASPLQPCGRKATEQSLSTLPTNKEMRLALQNTTRSVGFRLTKNGARIVELGRRTGVSV